MDEPTETLISPAMIEAKGRWKPSRLSPPIAPSDIRRWAIATYWPETPPPIYWDEDYARTTRWGGVIAPQDFNPFTWPIDRPRPATRVTPLGGPGLASMNGGMKDTYGVPMRPGDVITSRARLADFEERRGRLGLTIYVHNELEWTNQTGQLVRRRILTVLRYRADRIP